MFLFMKTTFKEFDRLCIGMAKAWMAKHDFTRTDDIWDDAVQCARLGFLLYLRKNEITKAEDVFREETSLVWILLDIIMLFSYNERERVKGGVKVRRVLCALFVCISILVSICFINVGRAETHISVSMITKDSDTYDIVLLRRRLRELGWLTSNMKADDTGLYTARVTDAITQFQKYIYENMDQTMIVDGIAGKQTISWLNRNDAPVNPDKPKPTPGPTPKSTERLYPTGVLVTRQPTLEPTSTPAPEDYDEQVAEIQKLLVKAGWMNESDITGIYDDNTIEAVIALQRQLCFEYGIDLDYDGYYGPRERQLLESGDERAIAPDSGKSDELTSSDELLGLDGALSAFEAEEPVQPQPTATEKSRENADFKSFQWGDSSSYIMSIEGDPLLSQYDSINQTDNIYYMSSPCGIACLLGYRFRDDRLYSCGYVSTTTYTHTSSYVKDYETFKKALTDKYGKPILDEIAWDNSRDEEYYANDINRALEYGKLQYQACWETSRNHIELILQSENYKIALVVRYDNKVFDDTAPDYSKDF